MAHVRYLDCQWKRFVTGQLIKLRLAIYDLREERQVFSTNSVRNSLMLIALA